MKKIALAVMGAALTAASAGAMAYEAGDVIVRAGLVRVTPHETDTTVLGKLEVNSNTQLGINAAYMLTPTIGVEALGATPFKHKITLAGNEIGETKHLPPTLTLQWYPKIGETVQPYVGIGVNYTNFFKVKNNLGVDLDLSNSTGLAAEAGVDVKVSNNLYVNAAVWKIDINTNVSINGANMGTLELDPLAAMVGVGYKF